MTFVRNKTEAGPPRIECDGWKCAARVEGYASAAALRARARNLGWRKISPIGDRCPNCQPGTMLRRRPS